MLLTRLRTVPLTFNDIAECICLYSLSSVVSYHLFSNVFIVIEQPKHVKCKLQSQQITSFNFNFIQILGCYGHEEFQHACCSINLVIFATLFPQRLDGKL